MLELTWEGLGQTHWEFPLDGLKELIRDWCG